MAAIIEALESAENNLKSLPSLGMGYSKMIHLQVKNARILLEKGYGIWTDIEEMIEEHGSIDDVPENPNKPPHPDDE